MRHYFRDSQVASNHAFRNAGLFELSGVTRDMILRTVRSTAE